MTKIPLRKNLPCRAGEPGKVEVAPETSLKTVPAGLSGTMRADYPAKAPPPHLTATQVTDRCGDEPQGDLVAIIWHVAATTYGNHLQMTPVQRRVTQADEKVAERPGKACLAAL